MAYNKLKRVCFLLLVSLFFITSCESAEIVVADTSIDRSFLEREPCAPPCWYGLELGKSTEEDVYDVLKKIPFVKQDSILQKGTGWGNNDSATVISYKCTYKKNASCGRIYVKKDKVIEISTSVNYDLPLSLVIDEIGEPDYLIYNSPRHYIGCNITLYWPEKQISVYISSEEECPSPNTKFKPNSKVTSLTYMVPEGFTVTEENQSLWPGFAKP
jgi:hypothetical protein